MVSKEVRSRRIAVIHPTNAIAKRVLLISGTLQHYGSVRHICWKRFPRSNVSDGLLISASSFVAFSFGVLVHLLGRHYDGLLVDDLRLVPVTLLARIRGTRVIYNRQEVPTATLAEKLCDMFSLSFPRAIGISEWIENWFGRHVDCVVTIPLREEYMVRIRQWGRPVESVWNVPDTRNAELPVTPVRSLGSRYFIYSGGISEKFGLRQYLRLASRLRDYTISLGEPPIKLVLIGHLWNLSRVELFSLIDKEAGRDCVEYKEWVPYEELIPILHGALFGVSIYDPDYAKFRYMGEGASRKIFTYMECGLPVIASPPFGVTVARENSGFCIDYADEVGLFEKAKVLISDSTKRMQMRKNGIEAIRQRYCWQNEETKLHSLFRSCFAEET